MFKALVVDENGSASVRDVDDSELGHGDVDVDVEYSSLNYKDALAIKGRNKIIRNYPMVPGIDFAGVVRKSDNPSLTIGDRVVLNGWEVGEKYWGGFSQRARVKAEWLVKLPDSVSTKDAMGIGTAGFTAMLAILALEDHAVRPSSGPVLVTGAAGGLGSMAIALLAARDYHVVASTGRLQEGEYLQKLGAKEIVDRETLQRKAPHLGTSRWAAAIDCVGSHTLANVIASLEYGGTVAACGLAQGMDLSTSVAPFILRAVTLVGINSVLAPSGRRVEAWNRLAIDMDRDKLAAAQSMVGLDDVCGLADPLLAGKIRGRIVVDVNQ